MFSVERNEIKYFGIDKNIVLINNNFKYFYKNFISELPKSNINIKNISKVYAKFELLDYDIILPESKIISKIKNNYSHILYIFGTITLSVEYTNFIPEGNINRTDIIQYVSDYINLYPNISIHSFINPFIRIEDIYCKLLDGRHIYSNIIMILDLNF